MSSFFYPKGKLFAYREKGYRSDNGRIFSACFILISLMKDKNTSTFQNMLVKGSSLRLTVIYYQQKLSVDLTPDPTRRHCYWI
jgi:hypothetical protein